MGRDFTADNGTIEGRRVPQGDLAPDGWVPSTWSAASNQPHLPAGYRTPGADRPSMKWQDQVVTMGSYGIGTVSWLPWLGELCDDKGLSWPIDCPLRRARPGRGATRFETAQSLGEQRRSRRASSTTAVG